MWNLIMFDLPVKTRQQRRRATAFRNLLLDLGWLMAQYSVYVRYVPTGTSVTPELQRVKQGIPPQGRVQVIAVTDRQWTHALRFINATPLDPGEPPDLLTLF